MCGVLVILPRASATAVILVLCMALLICLLCHVGQQELELQPVYRTNMQMPVVMLRRMKHFSCGQKTGQICMRRTPDHTRSFKIL